MRSDPQGDLHRSEIINSGSLGDAVAVGGVLVLLAWPLARLLTAASQFLGRRRSDQRA